jgi:hypothetical protein
MRLATWNCQTGLDSNWDKLDELNADVLTVQECGPETEAQAAAREGWTCAWQAGRYYRGLAVLARSPYRIATRERSEPCVVSTLIAGPGDSEFRFVGFWAMTPISATKDGYPMQATRLIEQIPVDDIPTVLAGDFNASWRNKYHLKNVERLAARGLVNAYNSSEGIGDDVDPRVATSYFRWQRENVYHMDFVYVPSHWSIQSVEVGSFEDYPERGLSDHVPVIVSISPEQPS